MPLGAKTYRSGVGDQGRGAATNVVCAPSTPFFYEQHLSSFLFNLVRTTTRGVFYMHGHVVPTHKLEIEY